MVRDADSVQQALTGVTSEDQVEIPFYLASAAESMHTYMMPQRFVRS